MTKMVHGFTFWHPCGTRSLCPRIAVGVQTTAFNAQHLASPTKFTGAILRRPGIHLREKIAALRKLIEELSQARPNAQEAFSAGFLPGQLAATKSDRLGLEIDLVPVQAGDVGL